MVKNMVDARYQTLIHNGFDLRQGHFEVIAQPGGRFTRHHFASGHVCRRRGPFYNKSIGFAKTFHLIIGINPVAGNAIGFAAKKLSFWCVTGCVQVE